MSDQVAAKKSTGPGHKNEPHYLTPVSCPLTTAGPAATSDRDGLDCPRKPCRSNRPTAQERPRRRRGRPGLPADIKDARLQDTDNVRPSFAGRQTQWVAASPSTHGFLTAGQYRKTAAAMSPDAHPQPSA